MSRSEPVRVSWVVGVLIAVVGGMASIAYSAVTTRLTDLERDRKSAVLVTAEVQRQLTALQVLVQAIRDEQIDTRNDNRNDRRYSIIPPTTR